ncbi:MAG TPA: tetratricopeptide repeat protein [Gammaproteobacteria bacterium]|nr:tetratricopeptide repeat protein [Gammaproteobacteria bacterium]
MDEFLSEKEQIERLRDWWRENGWFLVGGVALGALALFGWHQYQRYLDNRSVHAEALYGQVRDALGDNDRDSAAKLVEQLRDEYGSSPYTDQAGLLLARAYLVTDTSKAADELRYVMDHTRDHELGLIARLRLARVLIYEKKEQAALDLLAVDEPGEFAAQIDEVRGDAYVALGEADAARTAYASALTAPGADWVNRNFLQMKIDALGPPEKAESAAGSETANPEQSPAGGAGEPGAAGAGAGATGAGEPGGAGASPAPQSAAPGAQQNAAPPAQPGAASPEQQQSPGSAK